MYLWHATDSSCTICNIFDMHFKLASTWVVSVCMTFFCALGELEANVRSLFMDTVKVAPCLLRIDKIDRRNRFKKRFFVISNTRLRQCGATAAYMYR